MSAVTVVKPQIKQPVFGALPPLALYIHIPWCVRKCPYCDFNSHEIRREIPEANYIDVLIADLEAALPQIWGRRVYTVFFGGGTPSVFSAAGIERILAAVRARVSLAVDAEITLEANPGTAEMEKFRGFREAGVNRLSLGIQSFNRRQLKALGRIHDDNEARAAIEIACANFENFNLDLMYGLPQQSVNEALADIGTALSFAPPHLSVYHLTIEPNTYFYRYPPALPDDDNAAQMQEGIEQQLASAGYQHYETSAFAQTGAQCRHNLNYWTFGDYLGIGAGAHSKLSLPGGVMRQARYKQPKQYLESALTGNVVQESHDIAVSDIGFEFMMNTLRLDKGFPVALFEERTGLPLTTILNLLEQAEQRGFIERDHQRIAPTALGRRFLNDLLQIFLPDELQL
jgi:putative oxygen-independent coproporphyrinogen III oxidase